MKHIALLLFFALSVQAQVFGPATRVRRGAGAPSSGECASAGDVGKVWVRQDWAAANYPIYACANNGVGTYAWLTASGGGGGTGDVGGGSGLTTADRVVKVSSSSTVTQAGWAMGSAGLICSSGDGNSAACDVGTTGARVRNVNAAGTATLGGALLFATDNAVDIGASGANRPRNLFIAGYSLTSGAIYAGSSINFGSGATSVINGSGTNGNIVVSNAAGNSFGLLQFGGTTSSFPALKRSTTELQAKLADDSAFTKIRSSGVIVDGATGTNCLLADGTTGACGSAPTDAQYLMLATNGSTSDERVATAGTGITITDGGAGGNATIAADTAVMLSRATDQAGTGRYCRSTTGNDTYTCTLTPTLTAYTRGMCLALDADTANTGTATVNVDTLGAKSILGRSGGALSNADVPANRPVTICYDGTQFIQQGAQMTSALVEMRFGECDNNGVGTIKMWSIPSTGGAGISCVGSSPHTHAAGTFSNAADSSLERNFQIPYSWSGGTVQVNMVFGEVGNVGSGNVGWKIYAACMNSGDAFVNPSYGAALATTGNIAVDNTSGGTGDKLKTSSVNITLPVGCSAGSYARVRLTRDVFGVTGNYANPINMVMFSLLF